MLQLLDSLREHLKKRAECSTNDFALSDGFDSDLMGDERDYAEDECQTDEDESREVVPIDLEDKAECSSTDIGLSNNVSDSDSSYAR